MKCLRFVEQRFQVARKQTGLPEAGNNLRKSYFIMCHVTRYSKILRGGPYPICQFERGEGPGDEVDIASAVNFLSAVKPRLT